MDLPAALTASAEEVALNILSAWKKGKEVIYTNWYIMFIMRNIPERIFKKLPL